MARIAVAMSGGVDSSVTAYLLQRAGHTVRGVFMKNYEPPPQSNQPCPWEADQEDVRRVCERLGVTWETWNFERDYAERVLDYFFREYSAGRTPNPDVMCNREVKFGVFLQRALSEGFDAIATGHYARIREVGGAFQLLAGVDRGKDQSYFLHALNQSMLSRTYFPIGNHTKTEVRGIARSAKLPTAEKPDSQGICFVGKVNVTDFLKQHLHALPGPVVTASGARVGEHIGLPYYTIGQRHGLGVGGGVPYYVARKNLQKNTLIVAEGDRDPILYARALEATAPTWVSGQVPGEEFSCNARIRYRQPLVSCTVRSSGETLHVTFAQLQRAITPGQAIVFYDEDVCLGGATIDHVLEERSA